MSLESVTREYQILLEMFRQNPEDETLEEQLNQAWKEMEVSWLSTSVLGLAT